MSLSSSRPKTFVFYDSEGTGLPDRQNLPRFTEICFLAVSREDLVRRDTTPRVVNKLSVCLNPEKNLNQSAINVSGLTRADLQECPTFKEQVPLLIHFLKHLPKPVCLVAHNGLRYDFPLLAKYLEDAGVNTRDLEDIVTCADSVTVFQNISPSPRQRYKLDDMYRQVGGSQLLGTHNAEFDCRKLMEIVRKKDAVAFVDDCHRTAKPLHFYTRPEEFNKMFSR